MNTSSGNPDGRVIPRTAGVLVLVLYAGFLAPAPARGDYVEVYQGWQAATKDAWEVKDLSGAPFNVPGNAVVEVAVRNTDNAKELWGGIRAVGSSLDRRFSLHKAEGGGFDFLVIHVQTDHDCRIEHYSDSRGPVDLILLGYWPCRRYVEAFQSFSAGADASWQDHDLSTYGVSPDEIAEIVLGNDNLTNEREAGVRTNGSSLSRVIDIHDAEDGGIDVASMWVQADGTANATIEVYAEVNADVSFYLAGYWETPPGSFTERFSDLGSPSTDATWEDKDLTGFSVPADAVVEIVLANTFATQENQMGARANGSSLARLQDLHEAEDGGGDFGRMHVLADADATIEFYHEDVSDSHSFLLTGYWEVDSAVNLDDHVAGQESNAFTNAGGETDAELFAFTLAPCGFDTITITELAFSLSDIDGLVDGDWADVEIVIDTDGDGDIEVGETTTVGGSGTVGQAAGTITFSTSFDVSSATYYILRADFADLSGGDVVTIDLYTGSITTTATIVGSTSTVTHVEMCAYVESSAAWSATVADTWQVKDLSGAPFNVPADAVVEVAVRNDRTSSLYYGGVRAVGSTMSRRFQLRDAEGGGVDVVVMHVQADGNSRIEHYSDSTAYVDFVLLGYWPCGTYVEAFDTFTAGAGGSWQDLELCAYGVVPEGAAEIVMANADGSNEREAGVRTNGSSLQRRLDLNKAEGGGVDTATMLVKADASVGAAIELYAENDASIAFHLVGYWSVPPGAYTELFADAGTPAADGSWENLDLSGNGVPDHATAEFALSNDYDVSENSMGVRENDSSLSRFLDLREAKDGGGDFGRMHVQTDAAATIEFYHEDASDDHTFRLVGYWSFCDSSLSYTVADLGVLTAGESSLGLSVNATRQVAGYDEDVGGDPGAWLSECGSFTSLGTLGGSDAEALGINDSTEVVGWAHDGSGNRRAYIWDSGSGMTDLGTISGRSDSEAAAINNNSEVVGTVSDFGVPPANRLAFIDLPAPAYTLGAGMTSLGTLGGDQSVAMDINDSGQVVGGALNVSSYMRPFRWINGSMADLGTLGGESGSILHRGEAINAAGDVVGLSYTAGGHPHAFFWDSSMTDLGVLTGGDTSWALGINDSDLVVGTSNVTGGAFHAFVWDSANGMRDLNDLVTGNWTLTRAYDINNSGSITGFGTNPSGDVRTFLLTPTCSAGGGAARSLSSGWADADGTFEGAVTADGGEILAEIVVVDAIPGEAFEIVTIPGTGVDPAPGPGPGTFAGFADGIALGRTMTVETSALSGDFNATVNMIITPEELLYLEVEPEDVELHVLDATQRAPPGTWVPAGTNLGESAPTGILGDSGFEVYTDESIGFWAVRDAPGIFAVGAKTEEPDPEPNEDGDEIPDPQPVPRLCGLGLIPWSMACLTALVVTRTRRWRPGLSADAPLHLD